VLENRPRRAKLAMSQHPPLPKLGISQTGYRWRYIVGMVECELLSLELLEAKPESAGGA
jgi:hypothetical protein